MASVQRYAWCPMTTKTYVSGIDQLRKRRVEVWSLDRGVFLLGLKATVLRLLALFMFIGLTADSFLAATAASKPAQTTSAQESGTAAPETREHGFLGEPTESG